MPAAVAVAQTGNVTAVEVTHRAERAANVSLSTAERKYATDRGRLNPPFQAEFRDTRRIGRSRLVQAAGVPPLPPRTLGYE